MSSAPPPGLQPERTALAWRRTALGLATGSLVAGRLLAPALGAWSWWVAGAGVVLAGGLGVAAHRRSARPTAGGALVAVCAGVALAVGVLALVVVLRAGS